MKRKTNYLLTALAALAAAGVTLTALGEDPKPEAPKADDKPAKAEAKDDKKSEKGSDKTKAVDLVFDKDGNLMPKHFNERTQKAIENGMEFLKRTQNSAGSWAGSYSSRKVTVAVTGLAGMALLAGGNTTSRGPYADVVKKAVRYLIKQADPQTGMISSAGEYRPMYGHGFSMLFLASAYGMESDKKVRAEMKTVIENGVKLISKAQSVLGGWYYDPDSQSDEGSVTVTQLQALRAASNAGFIVPESTIKKSIKYLEICRTPEGGIRYSARSGGSTKLAISAAALPCMYSTGDYESDMAKDCLAYVFKNFCGGNMTSRNWSSSEFAGHSYYGHYYAAQAFYQAGDKYWDTYFPGTRDQLLSMQGANNVEGAWYGNSIGPVYGTAMALTILQLPYKYLPIYQR